MGDVEVCEECDCTIECDNDNIYIITKEDEEKLWCQSCFEDMWKDAYNDGWTGDDIEQYLEIEKENKKKKKNKRKT